MATHPLTAAQRAELAEALHARQRALRADVAAKLKTQDDPRLVGLRNRMEDTDDWAAGGTTAFDNLSHLCPAHHHLKHETSWSVRHLGEGALEWRSPTGRLHRTDPAVSIPTATAPTATPAAAESGTAPRPPGDRSSSPPSLEPAHASAGPPF